MSGNDSKKLKVEVPPKTIGTHSGTFHCDEVLACYMLSQHPDFQDHKILRTRNQDLLDQCDIVVDVGGVFDSNKKRFDHHQSTFNETFSSLRPELDKTEDIKLSSAGLIYVYYGETIIQEILKKLNYSTLTATELSIIFVKIYKGFIREIDGIDNGVPQFESEPRYSISTHLSNRVKNFNPDWTDTKTPEEIDELFNQAKAYVGEEFLDKIKYYGSKWLPARKIVEEAVDNRFKLHLSGEIIELQRFCPWQEHLRQIEKEIGGIEIKFVICDGGSNDFRVQCVPVKEGSFVCRKFLNKKWFGIRNEELEKVSGIDGTVFCHATGFIGGNKTREGALKMAEKSLTDED
ncbi:CLUMA_CG013097, isoform A [Clunio marinus]|uniref:CLUMA_CG013097, isoform A n=1 Tax=Clunio marinus TaxID=568069 RepID=A0A1J1IHR0_9DIPT|nr:CLUMA_CG013097, isoform A [Clunio marinus]